MKIGIYYPDAPPFPDEDAAVYVPALALAHAETHDVEIVHHACDETVNVWRREWKTLWRADFSRVTFRHVPRPGRVDWETWRPLRRLRMEYEFCGNYSAPYDVFFAVGDTPPVFNHAKKGVLLTTFPRCEFSEFFGHHTPAWRQQNFLKRFLKRRYQKLEWRARFGSYHHFLCPSRFAKTWCTRRWGFTPAVLPPAVPAGFQFSEESEDAAEKKENVILGVSPSLVEAFQVLREKHSKVAKNWHLEVLENRDAETALAAYTRAAFFWHMTGVGVDEQKTPQAAPPSGLPAARAMTAGAIPLVFHAGAMAETVHHMKDGFLVSSPAELILTTAELMKRENEKAVRMMRKLAAQRAKAYDMDALRMNLKKNLPGVLE